ncbi:MAG TPA: DNA-binding protein [Gallionellaceae bacterium]|nr:DNA-binding protein [Gallionellaceae bacterium]
MTLQNLLSINRLQSFTPDRGAVQKLLRAAQRNLEDARLTALSSDNRFDAAYKTIMQCAMLGLWANGYRTSTNQPGHHLTAIQSLPLTMQVSGESVIVLDALRKQRNLNDYEGDPIADSALSACLDEADMLLAHTQQWLRKHHPELASEK